SLFINGFIRQDEIVQKWFFWWVPNFASVLMFTPFILSWTRGFNFKLTRNHITEILIAVFFLMAFIFLLNLEKLHLTVLKSSPFLVIPFLLWLAFRFNLQISMSGILATALLAIYFTTIARTGPFILDTNENSIIILQIFIGMVSSTTIALSSTVYERGVAQNTIKKFNDTLEVKIMERTKELNDEINIRKKAEHDLKITNVRLRKANIELDNFVYRVSHDLRAPVASVLGLVNLAKNEKEASTVMKYFAMVGKSAEQQDRFIRDILDISRNTKLGIERKKISFRNLLDETLEQLKYTDNSKKIDTKLNVNASAAFYSDPHRLKVILNNIISNSIRYSNGQHPTVNIDVNVTQEQASISIKDNGIGIDKIHHKKVFNMFYRATDDNAGSGLGLYIVKESIDKLNGTVDLESDLGMGTTVHLKVPNLINGNTFNENGGSDITPLQENPDA
ncbi:MAG TPA: ATP-binding protein, partial [Cyclobacteriaceae bacterium]|nr:ATP-binding protein [Cyclobacteriaceae bacterium]